MRGKFARMGMVHQLAEQKQRAEYVEDAAERRGVEESHEVTCDADL